ncbi:MAG: 3-hydroxybutyrate dehydrogenase [Hyphomicrobiaceae bacterium]|nr:3-hydroxybutyrate dehydrogenase [Hyphomicrobiaceae bacterium]
MGEIKTILVTGSSSGIGLGVARRFAAAGYNVALNSFEPESRVADVIDGVAAAGAGRAAYFEADLSARGAGVELVERVIAHFGQLDVLVNNAGIQKVSPVEEFELDDWARVRSIILDSSFEAIKASVPGMAERGWGRIINIASAHGLVASPFKSAYVSAKHGMMGLTKTVALEVAEKGITVNAICPGYVLTPLVEAQLKDQARVHGISEDEVKREIMLAPQPTKQFVGIDEVAELAFYLSGDLARSITGTAISIDGGWTAR